MKVVICPDKFKGSLLAADVCIAVEKGLRNIHPGSIVESVPLADGGEGTCALLTEWDGGKSVTVEVMGPLFSVVEARYGISKDGRTAFIEMAEASGLTLIAPEQRDPLLTSTFGTGQMIADALSRGVKTIVLGIGGSATNDAGIGMASALGYVFCDAQGETLKPTGENLINIRHLKTDSAHAGLKDLKVIALCDVTNVLYGPQGAAYIYGPQKGADERAVELLDAGLRNFRRVVHKQLGISVDFPGAGAAGGLGAGVKVFLGAAIQKGVHYMIARSKLDEKIKNADLVITGEGKIDNQTFSGKVVAEVMGIAKIHHKPVVAVCGVCELPEDETSARGLTKIIALVRGGTSADSAIQNASQLITERITEDLKTLPTT